MMVRRKILSFIGLLLGGLPLMLAGCGSSANDVPRPIYSSSNEKICMQIISRATEGYRLSKSPRTAGIQAEPHFKKLVGLDCSPSKILEMLIENGWVKYRENKSPGVSNSYRITTSTIFGFIKNKYDLVVIEWSKSGVIVNVRMGFGGALMTDGSYV